MSEEEMETTSEEEKAIRALRRLAKIWPNTLWLFSASGSLQVMKKNADGEKACVGVGFDPDFSVETIDIENDGGDW